MSPKSTRPPKGAKVEVVLAKHGYCTVCGQPMRLRYPGGDAENGPARPACADEQHGCPTDDMDSAKGEGIMHAFRDVMETLEMFLDAAGDPTHETAKMEDALQAIVAAENYDDIEAAKELARVALDGDENPQYALLRKLRTALVERIMEMPEAQWDDIEGTVHDRVNAAAMELDDDRRAEHAERMAHVARGDLEAADAVGTAVVGHVHDVVGCKGSKRTHCTTCGAQLLCLACLDCCPPSKDLGIYGDSKKEQAEGKRYEEELAKNPDWRVDESEGNNN